MNGLDKDYFREGNLIHDFAEWHVTHPCVLDDDAIEDVVSLCSNVSLPDSRIEDVRHEDQHEVVLATVQEIAHKEDYEGEDDEGEPRCPGSENIAVDTQDFDICAAVSCPGHNSAGAI